MGDAGKGHCSFVWIVELVGETVLRCLEFGASMFDVVSMAGM